jgi:virulence factor
MKPIIERYKQIRKSNTIQKNYVKKYAFAGIGNHSLQNLYPALDYLKVPLKYIVTKTERSRALVAENYLQTTATSDFANVLNDSEIGGIFICAAPQNHFELTRRALETGKNVFVEKPACLSLGELKTLIDSEKQSEGVCLVGMQKRYSTVSKILSAELKNEQALTYNYRFQVGAYPESNPFFDIFIHPVDYMIYLFGDAEIVAAEKSQHKNGKITVLLILKHKNNIIGNIEISTDYTWITPRETLSINTNKNFYEMENHQLLSVSGKPKSVFSIPLEKILPAKSEYKILFDGNSFLPVFNNNTLVTLGYFNEIQTFINICENKKCENKSSLTSLIKTYEILEKLS